ncbi:collagen-like domain-containing protein [Streptomyces xanthii]|uniref:Extensin n=1 Tax=Streptomyces xanthii TaxID=2768069 RepID=A0A7H1B702_9ACTN|nr:hypothetical protein [Streptomyces xanthii]QNS04507.1 hypothetical protein IAG42_13350 [Streptomyces xanthii]
MADEHDKWLDREAAERLLRGEPLEAVAEQDALHARRLTAALDSLTALPAGPDGELPGEDAALKAFREARAVPAGERAAALGTPVTLTGRTARAGRHRGGAAGAPARPGPDGRHGPRWGRPVRFGLAAAVAACMVGGVAVAAGTGVLPSPFDGWSDPSPTTSVSSAPSEEPLVSPSGSAAERGEAVPDGERTSDGPSGSPDARDGRDASKDPRGGTAPSASPGNEATDPARGSDALRRRITETCAKYRTGEIGADEKRQLRESMKESGRAGTDLGRFCDRVLGQPEGSGDEGSDNGGKTGDEDEDGNDDGEGGDQPPALPTVTPTSSPDASGSSAYGARPVIPVRTVSATAVAPAESVAPDPVPAR